MDVILGPPFSGKSQFAASQIEEREAGGELGLLRLDFSRLWAGIAPGIQSSYRDEAVSDTGAPRLAGYAFEVLMAEAIRRELRGYILLNSPRRAMRILPGLASTVIHEMTIGPGEVAARVQGHLSTLRRQVPRARTDAADSRCAEAVTSYYRERPEMPESVKVRKVRQRGNRFEVGKPESSKYDRDAFLRGLTPAGHDARADLLSEGIEDPKPAEIMRRLLHERRIANG